jgi:hypothetical protein
MTDEKVEPALHALPDEDREALRVALENLKAAGEPPLIPLNVDLDGDGIVDAWTLNDKGEVELVPGQNLEDTAYVSDGEDIEEG